MMSEHPSSNDFDRQAPDWYERWLEEEAAMPHSQRRGVAAFGVLLFLCVMAFLVLLGDFTGNPAGLCGACHTMRPHYYTWQASSHSQQSCLDCHADPGLRGTAKLLRDLARFTYTQATGSYILPIRLLAGVGDETCLRCHTFNRGTTATGDLIIPHADHSDGQVRCVACHDGVAHGNIGRRRVALEIPSASWDLPEGRRQMDRLFTAAPKEDCMSCHFNRRLALSCQDCHEDDKTPEDHLADDFIMTHGSLAREMPNCYHCHGFDARGRKIKVSPGENLTAYTRRNDFCLDCHRQRPPSHQPDFRNHRVAAVVNLDSCMICHDNQPQAYLPEASILYCGACHPSPHRDGWQELHNRRRRGAKIFPGQGLDDTCFQCHARDRCLACHIPPPAAETPIVENELSPALPVFP